MAGRKDSRQRLKQAREGVDAARVEMAAAAIQAKGDGVTVEEIAELLGFKTRRAVYLLIERGR